MEKFELLKLLMTQVENFYADEKTSKNLDSFIIWLTVYLTQIEDNNNIVFESTLAKNNNIDSNIGTLNGLVYRYSRLYSKEALEHSTKLSFEEFSFLASLTNQKGCTKTALINSIVFEKSTGLEIIKRLIKVGLISEETNPLDKRSKVLAITDSGESILYEASKQMAIVSKEITAVLSMAEKKALYHLLWKLASYHKQDIDNNEC